MIKYFQVLSISMFLTGFIGCESDSLKGSLQTIALTNSEQAQVDQLLEDLYRSFSYNGGVEPDWDLMRSGFIEGAQFVTEPTECSSLRPQTIAAFVESRQRSIRGSDIPTVKTTEEIIETKTSKIGNLIRVDVLFRASKANDPHPRKPGFDSLILAQVNGVWKILSFVIHYESKL